MPSALETLVKILKLEREQGCKNTAVIGGLAAFSQNWQQKAHSQARRPEHQVLADELVDLMREYDTIDNATERLKQINYMLDRITGREPPPPEYQEKLAQLKQSQSGSGKKKRGDRGEKSKRSSRKDRSSRAADPEKKPDSGKPGKGDQDDQGSSSDLYDVEITPVEAGDLDIQPMPKLARPPRGKRPEWGYEDALAALQQLEQPVTAVKGVGEKVASQLEALGIYTVNDLLTHFPRRYDDYTRLSYIRNLQPGVVATVIGTVRQTQVRVGRGGRKDFFMILEDGSGSLAVTFFGQHFLVRSIRQGQQVVVSGKTSLYRDTLQMTNPEWEALDSENLHSIGIVPVYPLTEGVTARALRRLMKNLVDEWVDRIPDYIPEATLERTELADLGWSLRNLHFPEGWDHLYHARRRYLFDQLLTLQLAILANRREWQSVPGQPLTVTDEFLESFTQAVFPYELTGAQQRAIQEIRRDITRDVPMNRLLQGDVGSGKTAVAVTAMAMAVADGKQAALMAPTSVLAEQHYRGISALLENWPGEQRPVVGLLTGATGAGEREGILNGVRDGSVDILIGTHALIQESVAFHNLAVAVIDEQHRFGVQQRGRLRGKGTNPHLLVMTATPIPRTLALTIYADLDLSIIDEKPAGRQPVDTRVLMPVQRERAFVFIEGQLNQGRQAFVVHPLVEASEKVEARSAVEAFEELSQVFHRYRVCLLHGRMRAAEKEEIMAAFANHEYDVMVTTSVAEVGVDVPNASVILIEGANRFGLAQLHQFRGRVGRGEHPSYCLLIPDAATEESQERLRAMEETDDGFRLAELDWKLRGAGDLLGVRQSGQHVLQLAEEMTPDLVRLAQQEARTIYEEDPWLEREEHRLLAHRVTMMHNQTVGDIS